MNSDSSGILFEMNDYFSCQISEWDSKYFGVACARVELYRDLEQNIQNQLLKWIKPFGFVTLLNGKGNVCNTHWLHTQTTAVLTDVRVQLHLDLAKQICPAGSEIYNVCNNVEHNHDVVNIASNAFIYSRFINDKNITTTQAKGVYTNWVENAFNKRDKFFCIAYNEGIAAGFILFSIKNQHELIIELVGLDTTMQGMGVGSKLMHSVLHYAKVHHIDSVQVATQVENVSAINYYMKNGFKGTDIKYIYHFWNK
ncbi:GNAT family N-acetyltransferase [Paenibacillus popilliae]|uniref:Acetyltransferase n=1 Tax=Paenibacillus popilliae ATCC 14706 TaxID=1212764 RepID=M9M2G4_PAEPP|nr:GNAT family N-acetyltransferase [Paenibacillus popilliae]GAC41338.1 acetyltransferase [Paenibacillus popilliae ATCC 14706]